MSWIICVSADKKNRYAINVPSNTPIIDLEHEIERLHGVRNYVVCPEGMSPYDPVGVLGDKGITEIALTATPQERRLRRTPQAIPPSKSQDVYYYEEEDYYEYGDDGEYEEMIRKFIEITNASRRDANNFLDKKNWDLDAAAQLYFDTVPQEDEIQYTLTEEQEAITKGIMEITGVSRKEAIETLMKTNFEADPALELIYQDMD